MHRMIENTTNILLKFGCDLSCFDGVCQHSNPAYKYFTSNEIPDITSKGSMVFPNVLLIFLP